MISRIREIRKVSAMLLDDSNRQCRSAAKCGGGDCGSQEIDVRMRMAENGSGKGFTENGRRDINGDGCR